MVDDRAGRVASVEDAPLLGRASGAALTLGSALALLAAWTLSVDKVKLLQDPSFQPSCNFNPVLSCGSVMKTHQAGVFGFPNPFIGLVGFAIMLFLGILIAARVVLPRWIIAGGALGALLGAVFVHWLAFQSLYRIGALCPWCMVVWAVTIPTALCLVLATLDEYVGESGRAVVRAVWHWRFTLVALWYLGVVVLILIRFWSYWRTLG